MLECFQSNQQHEQLLWLEPWTSTYPWLKAGITTRKGGFSIKPYDSLNGALHVGDDPDLVLKNRSLISELTELPFQSFTCAEQVHGSAIIEVTPKEKGKGNIARDTAIQETDGIYTSHQDILLASFYADCVPLYFLAPRHKLVGLAHAGWKGTAAEIGLKMLRLWQSKYGLTVKDIHVAIGPSIGSCCYEVGEEVVLQIPNHEYYVKMGSITKHPHNKYTIDLKGINTSMFINEGINVENLLCSSYCTSCNADLFYSHRRDQGKTGRMVAFMAMKEGRA